MEGEKDEDLSAEVVARIRATKPIVLVQSDSEDERELPHFRM